MNNFMNLFPILFMLMFCLVFVLVIATVIKGVAQWNKNNHSPRLIVDALVVTKRSEMIRRRNTTTNLHHTSTLYYVTFQVESGDRFELRVEGSEYGMMVEGDKGKLTFQGTRFLDFTRT